MRGPLMGLFDEVGFHCRKLDCDNTLYVQSKADECVLKTFPSDAVPLAVAADISGDWVQCSECGTEYEVSQAPESVPLHLIPR